MTTPGTCVPTAPGGKRCPHLSCRNLGNIPVCLFFKVDLGYAPMSLGGRVEPCQECKESVR